MAKKITSFVEISIVYYFSKIKHSDTKKYFAHILNSKYNIKDTAYFQIAIKGEREWDILRYIATF